MTSRQKRRECRNFAAVMHNAPVLLVIDLIGVFVFALAGATAAVRQRLDLFGVLVLSFATASTGGILRDLLIGAVPRPPSPTGAIWPRRCSPAWSPSSGIGAIERLRNPVRVFDAAGLGLFAVAGTQKALARACTRSWRRCSACSRASAAA